MLLKVNPRPTPISYIMHNISYAVKSFACYTYVNKRQKN